MQACLSIEAHGALRDSIDLLCALGQRNSQRVFHPGGRAMRSSPAQADFLSDRTWEGLHSVCGWDWTCTCSPIQLTLGLRT